VVVTIALLIKCRAAILVHYIDAKLEWGGICILYTMKVKEALLISNYDILNMYPHLSRTQCLFLWTVLTDRTLGLATNSPTPVALVPQSLPVL